MIIETKIENIEMIRAIETIAIIRETIDKTKIVIIVMIIKAIEILDQIEMDLKDPIDHTLLAMMIGFRMIIEILIDRILEIILIIKIQEILIEMPMDILKINVRKIEINHLNINAINILHVMLDLRKDINKIIESKIEAIEIHQSCHLIWVALILKRYSNFFPFFLNLFLVFSFLPFFLLFSLT